MDDRPPADALLYFVDWLDRRDRISNKIAKDHLAAKLVEALAAELRVEAVENSVPYQRADTRGLCPARRCWRDPGR